MVQNGDSFRRKSYLKVRSRRWWWWRGRMSVGLTLMLSRVCVSLALTQLGISRVAEFKSQSSTFRSNLNSTSTCFLERILQRGHGGRKLHGGKKVCPHHLNIRPLPSLYRQKRRKGTIEGCSCSCRKRSLCKDSSSDILPRFSQVWICGKGEGKRAGHRTRSHVIALPIITVTNIQTFHPEATRTEAFS